LHCFYLAHSIKVGRDYRNIDIAVRARVAAGIGTEKNHFCSDFFSYRIVRLTLADLADPENTSPTVPIVFEGL